MNFLELKSKKEIFRLEPLGDGITRIRDIMDVGIYLIEGTEKAVLIDTGLGIGELRPLVNLLTDKPVEVYLTHGHVDHGGGIYGFETVFVPKDDLELLRWHTKPELRLDFAATYDPALATVEDIFYHMPYREMEIGIISPGDRIDLGGRTLTVIDLRGHTMGSVGYYDDHTKTLFAGDGCNNSTFLFLRESTTVTEYRAMLEKLKKEWEGKLQRIMICHGEKQEAPWKVIEDLIECCDQVLAGKGSGITFVMPYKPFQNGTDLWAMPGEDCRMQMDQHFGNLIYCAEKL